MAENVFEKYMDAAGAVEPIKYVGRVFRVQGLLIESRGPRAVIGEVCRLETRGGEVPCEVVGINGTTTSLMAYGETAGIEAGSRVTATGSTLDVAVSPALLGRILGPLGKPIDGKGEIAAKTRYPVIASSPPALERSRVRQRVVTGIRAIDGPLAVGRGQRLGVFAGSGVGKSTFQGMIARNTASDVNVVALIGERGRELNDFIEKDLGPEGLAKSVIVVSTSSESALARLRGAYVATACAEYFRDRGMNVMLLFDSVTRFARAQREIGLASGETAAQRGYTPSMFDSMPKLLERCGNSAKGSITGFYTVLVDGDDLDEPVSDTVRGILDGHIVLSRALAQRGHYPAVDILASVSRLSGEVSGPKTQEAVRRLRRLMADYGEKEVMIDVGAYKRGENPAVDEAIAKRPVIEEFLVQAIDESSSLAETLAKLGEITGIEIPDEERETA